MRAIFELRYDGWDAAGTSVSEVKRFTVDAGHQLDQIDSTFEFTGPASLLVAVGLNKTPADKGQDAKIAVTQERTDGTLLQWVQQATKGNFGTAVVLPSASGFAEDALNNLVLAKVEPGKPLRYWVGAAWDRAGKITSADAWRTYVKAEAERLRHPVRVKWSGS